MSKVGERLLEVYKQAQSVVCLEKRTVQPIGSNLSPIGFGRRTEYELRVQPDDEEQGAIKVVRELLRVNGRPPRERDAKARAACTDANPLSNDPLTFLLPSQRGDYTFTVAGFGKGKDAKALILEYRSNEGSNRGTLVEDPRGREDCFSWELSAKTRGRVVIDAESFQVLRLEEHMVGLAEIDVPIRIQRQHRLDPRLVVERYDTTIRYRMVSFNDPEESILLPESIDTLSSIRGGLESNRIVHVFSDYKRFLTGARIVK